MTRSISDRVQSVSIICAWVGLWIPIGLILHGKAQSERSRVLEVGGGGTRNAGCGGGRNDRTGRHVFDPGAPRPRGGIVGERGVAPSRSELLRAPFLHIVPEPKPFAPPIHVFPQRGR